MVTGDFRNSETFMGTVPKAQPGCVLAWSHKPQLYQTYAADGVNIPSSDTREPFEKWRHIRDHHFTAGDWTMTTHPTSENLSDWLLHIICAAVSNGKGDVTSETLTSIEVWTNTWIQCDCIIREVPIPQVCRCEVWRMYCDVWSGTCDVLHVLNQQIWDRCPNFKFYFYFCVDKHTMCQKAFLRPFCPTINLTRPTSPITQQ